MSRLFEAIRHTTRFTDDDSDRLRRVAPHVEPHYARLASRFYDRLLADADAARVLRGGEAQAGRLRVTLERWLFTGFSGPHDEAWYEQRLRIGRVHVRIEMPQHFMFSAMNGMRLDLLDILEDVYAEDPEERRAMTRSVERLLDVELAVMLHTYREDSEERLRRGERLAAIGQLAAGIAHDLRNPLGVIESSLYLLRKRVGDAPGVGRHLDKISAQVHSCNDIITALLELVRGRPPQRERVIVARLLDELVAECVLPDQIVLERETAPGLWLEADPGLLRQALVNLIDNAAAVQADTGGRIRIEARMEDEQVAIEVQDDGPGFPSELLGSVFEPLVTGSTHGTGLGLALVKSIVERHGGRVAAENRESGGATVSMRLPRSEPQETEPS